MTSAIERFGRTPEGARLLAQERLILQTTERIVELMQQQNVTRTELAKRLGRTKGWVSQLLAGEANFTLRTLADVFGALGLCAVVDGERRHDDSTAHAVLYAFVAKTAQWQSSRWPVRYTQPAETYIPDGILAG